MTPYRPLSYLERYDGPAIWEAGKEMSFGALLENVRRLQEEFGPRLRANENEQA